MLRQSRALIVVALSLVVLPFVLDLVGLPLRSSIDVVAFAIACMGLNILVGNTGLVSFGHGAWFGLGAYAAALSQRYWFPGSIILPALFAIVFVAVLRRAVRRTDPAAPRRLFLVADAGAYRAALCHWLPLDRVHWRRERTGGVTRATVLGVDLERDVNYYWVVAADRDGRLFLLWRFHRSPVGSVLVAIRENEQRARFIGYPTNRYKLIGFVLSAGGRDRGYAFGLQSPLCLGRTALCRVLGRTHRHGGDRRDAQLPRAGSWRAFFILFREFLSIWTPHWLFYFGLLFIGFIVFSPTGLIGVGGRLIGPVPQAGDHEPQRWRVAKQRTFCRYRETCCARMKMAAWPSRQAIWKRVSAASMPCAALTSRYAIRPCTP